MRQSARHFISFFDFLKEKNFIRPLSPLEIQHLRETVQEVHCSNCGASVNLQTSSACPFCHSPISMLDLQEQERMLAQLKEAASGEAKTVDPALPLKLAAFPLAAVLLRTNTRPGTV